jgi:hypothetical protein
MTKDNVVTKATVDCGDTLAHDGRTYMITSGIAPIDEVEINGKWYPQEYFYASACCLDDGQDGDGWQQDYLITWTIKEGALLEDPNDWDGMADWLKPDEIEKTTNRYNAETEEWYF